MPSRSEIAEGIYRLSTYMPDIAPSAGFTWPLSFLLRSRTRLQQGATAACSAGRGAARKQEPSVGRGFALRSGWLRERSNDWTLVQPVHADKP
jgi:hypothetical protein